jgi:ubiquinone/menaquinone biosynthesis C-methylase UbiE
MRSVRSTTERHRSRRIACLFILTGCCVAQVARKPNEDYATVERRQHAASEMDHPIRPTVEHSAELVESLGIRPMDAVADIGTGVGYLIPYLLSKVGPFGSVLAEDIFPEFVATVQKKVEAAGWRNVHAVLGTEQDPKLPPGQFDVAIVLDTYHHFNYPLQMLQHIRTALKPKGRLIIIEYYRSRLRPGAAMEDLQSHIRLDHDGVVAEVSAHGFHLTRSFDHMPYEYVLDFAR